MDFYDLFDLFNAEIKRSSDATYIITHDHFYNELCAEAIIQYYNATGKINRRDFYNKDPEFYYYNNKILLDIYYKNGGKMYILIDYINRTPDTLELIKYIMNKYGNDRDENDIRDNYNNYVIMSDSERNDYKSFDDIVDTNRGLTKEMIVKHYMNLIEDDPMFTESVIDIINFDYCYYDRHDIYDKTTIVEIIIKKNFIQSFVIMYESTNSIQTNSKICSLYYCVLNNSNEIFKYIMEDKRYLYDQFNYIDEYIWNIKNTNNEMIDIILNSIEFTSSIILSRTIQYVDPIKILNRIDNIQNALTSVTNISTLLQLDNLDLHIYIIDLIGPEKVYKTIGSRIRFSDNIIHFYINHDVLSELYKYELVTYLISCDNDDHLDLLKSFVERINYDLSRHENALVNVSTSSLKTVDYLIERGCDIYKKNEDGMTCIQKKIYPCDTSLYELLRHMWINHNFDFNLTNNDGYNCLHTAAALSDLRLIKFLIEEVGIDPNIQTKSGQTVAFICFSRHNLELINYILSIPGIDVYSKNVDGENCFNYITDFDTLLCVHKYGYDVEEYIENDFLKIAYDVIRTHQFD